MKSFLAVVAAITLTFVATPLAQADPVPEPRCNQAQLTTDIEAQVCLSVVGEYPNAAWQGSAWMRNTSAVAFNATMRVDLVFDTDVVYGDACGKRLAGNQDLYCTGRTDNRSVTVGPKARALIIKPGYQEYFYVSWWV